MARTALYTVLALAAFAANSVLARVALRSGAVDAASFSLIRFAGGAAALLAVTAMTDSSHRSDGAPRVSGSWTSAAVLFFYAVPFTFAYTHLTAATGALILFGCVQLTMMGAALRSGERPHPLHWLGLAVASSGLVYLVLPGLEAPPLAGAGLMALAGLCWGLYSLHGRGSTNPLAQTTGNFLRLVPLVLTLSLASTRQFHVERSGFLFAAASGVLASGLGYVIWYRALRDLSATLAGIVQLAVPVLAAAAGVVLLGEPLSARLIGASVVVLGGISMALVGRTRAHRLN